MNGIERIAAERARQLRDAAFCDACDGTGESGTGTLTGCGYCGGTGRTAWTPAHDDEHAGCELAWAAICYAAPGRVYALEERPNGFNFVDPWPWDSRWDRRPRDGSVLTKPTRSQRIRQLEKAGALLAAEIDRLTRLTEAEEADRED